MYDISFKDRNTPFLDYDCDVFGFEPRDDLQIITDYVSGMTDDYAVLTHKRLIKRKLFSFLGSWMRS